MAESRLTPGARAAIGALLGAGEDLAGISTWADQQREIPRTGPWHYVNMPIAEPRYDARFCPPEGCVVDKIEDFRRVLLDPYASRKEKQQALKFLVHFLQDMHQPVHVGDNGNRGGNDLQLRFFDAGTNLHRLLDSQVIDHYGKGEAQWARELGALAMPEKSADWMRGSPSEWANDSLEAAKALCCRPGSREVLKPGKKLGDEYFRLALPIVRLQLAKAAVRLAYTLNQIFR